MVSPMEKIQPPQIEASFDSLPFLFPDSWRPALLQWKKAAMEREGDLARRRQARLQELQDYVRQRLEEIKVKEQLKAAPATESDSDPPYDIPTRDFPFAVSPPPCPISTHHPLPSTQQPLPSTQQPLPSTQKPLPSTQQPLPTTQLPLPATQKPDWFTTTQQPLPSTLPPPSTHSSFISPRRKLFAPNSRESHTRAKKQDPYAQVTAMARGFLTRRLLGAQKVRDLIKTIKEASSVLSSLATPMATPISQQDEALKERVSIQLQVARQTLHEILFTLPVEEQMAYIAHSRHQYRAQRHRATDIQAYLTGPTPAGDVARQRGEGVVRGRLSTATMKAIERRRQQEAAGGSRGLVEGTRTTTSEQRGQQIRRQRQEKTTSTVSSSSRSSRTNRDSHGGPSSHRSQGGSFSRSQRGRNQGGRSQGDSQGDSHGGSSSHRSQGGSQGGSHGGSFSSRRQGDSHGGPSSSRSQGGRRGPGRNTTVADTAGSVGKPPKMARPKKT